MARRCSACQASVPWGTPQCLQCGARTVWWSALTTFGIAVGAGTALVVAVVIGRLWFVAPPVEVALQKQVADLLTGVRADPNLRDHIAGAGRCREPAGAICVQMTAVFMASPPTEQAQVVHRVHAVPGVHPRPQIILITPDGKIIPERPSP